MPRHISVSSAIDKNKITSSTPWIILVDIDVIDPNTRTVQEVVRLARNTENVIFNGDVYTAGNFSITINQQQNETPSVQLVAEDQMGLIQQKMEDYAGGVFSEVTMMIVNGDRLDKPAEVSERFQVVGSSADDWVVTFQLGAENPLQIQFPKHTQTKDRCAWRYKGYGCEYAGPLATCDYTKDGPNGCVAHDNQANFRALSGLVQMNI